MDAVMAFGKVIESVLYALTIIIGGGDNVKKTIYILLIICLLCCSGCEYVTENLESRAERGTINYVDFTDDVVADEDTHILYIYHNDMSNNAVLCPYYSKNGKLCRYEDGKIIEVEE